MNCSAEKGEGPGNTFLNQTRPNETEQPISPTHPLPQSAISNNFGEIKQMDRPIPTRLLHFTILCRSYSGPNVWKGSWLATVSPAPPSFNLFCCSCKIGKEEEKKKNPTFLTKDLSGEIFPTLFFFFGKPLHIIYLCLHMVCEPCKCEGG